MILELEMELQGQREEGPVSCSLAVSGQGGGPSGLALPPAPLHEHVRVHMSQGVSG